MNDPIAHHYVPKVYLKAFADSQKRIFQLKKQYKKISQKTITQICYEPHYFTIQREETKFIHEIADPFHIEKNVFKKHENEYEKILKKISFPRLHNLRISNEEIRTFLEILVTIKRRNPTMRKVLVESFRKYFNSQKLWEDVTPMLDLARRIDKIDPVEFIRDYIKVVNNDPTKLGDVYLRRFLGEEQTVVKNVVDTLMQFKIFINHAPFGNQFLTSDNPGFTVVGDIINNFGGLGGDFAFLFPLTPTCCLVIDSDESDNKYHLDKEIHIRQVQASAVDLINKSSNVVAMDKMFAYSKEALEHFAKDVLNNHLGNL